MSKGLESALKSLGWAVAAQKSSTGAATSTAPATTKTQTAKENKHQKLQETKTQIENSKKRYNVKEREEATAKQNSPSRKASQLSQMGQMGMFDKGTQTTFPTSKSPLADPWTRGEVQNTTADKLEAKANDLEKKKKPVGMVGNQYKEYNAHLQGQIDGLRSQASQMKTEAADTENWAAINAMPEEDRKALENYVSQRQIDWYNGLTNAVFNHNSAVNPESVNTNAQVTVLAQKYGWETVRAMAETLERKQNADATAAAQQEGAAFGQEHPVLGSIASIPMNVFSGISAAGERVRGLGTSTGQYPTLDPNNAGNLPAVFGGAVQGQVAENIRGDGDNGWRNAGAYLYQGGMSAAESGLRAVTGGTGNMLLSGLSSFEQNVSNASAQGASPQKAVILGLTNAAIEALSEEIPLDNLLEQAKQGGKGFTKFLKNALIQAGIEASTEEASLIGTTLMETAILRDKSEKEQYISARMLSGETYETAYNEWIQGIIDEAVDTAIVSGISGGLMSGVNAGLTKFFGSPQTDTQQQSDVQQTTDAQQGTQVESDTTADTQQPTQQVAGSPLQGETADPRRVAAQNEQATQGQQQPTGVFPQFTTDPQVLAEQTAALENQAAPDTTVQEKAANPALENLSPYPTPDTAQPQQQVEIDPLLEGIQQPPVAQQATDVQPQSATDAQQTAAVEHLMDGLLPNQQQEQAPTNAVPDTAAYMSKDGTQKAADPLSGDANAPRVTSQNATKNPTASDTSIPASSQNINGNTSTSGVQFDTQAAQASDTASGPAEATVGMQSAPSGDVKASRTYTNSGLHSSDADIRAAYQDDVRRHPDNPLYGEKHNADVMNVAKQRLSSQESISAEYDYLMAKDAWTAEDNVTAILASKELFKQGEGERSSQLNKKIQQINTNAGQISQSDKLFTTKDASDTFNTVKTAAERINAMEQSETTYTEKKNGPSFEAWKDSIVKNITDIGIEIDAIEDGDSASMQKIILEIARQRKTTAWFGLSSNLANGGNATLKTLPFSDLKVIANTQLFRMVDDFRRRGAGEVANGIRKSGMLASIKTFGRNLQGNSAVGLLDSFGDSTTGAIMDMVLSKVTGKRTTGNDLFRTGAYLKNAKNAASFAALCVELNIPVEIDAAHSYDAAFAQDTGGKYTGKTFRSDGNAVMRGMYAFQKYQAYALDVSDKVFEGGTSGAVSASLENLKGLNADERQRLADYTANRRTFKDATWETSDGRTHGSVLSRTAQGVKTGAGNLAENVGGKKARAVVDTITDSKSPFVQVPTNVAQTGIDYTTGVFKGAYEMASIIADAKKGVEIPVERQRQAVSDFGRGVTGLSLIGLSAVAAYAGLIRIGDDDDRDADSLHQSEGRSGAQINWSATVRGLSGGSTEWRQGDIISSLDSVEPFNTHLYMGAELAKEDDFLSVVSHFPKAALTSSYNAFMDSPMVSGLQGMVDDLSDIYQADDKWDTIFDKGAENIGEYVSTYIPQFVRQTAQYTDGYYRDTRGNTKLETAWNQVKASLPGLSQTLPAKVNGLGEVQKRPGFVQTFIDPTDTHVHNPNQVTTALDSLAEQTGDKSIYPDYRAPMSIKVHGETIQLDGEARTTYQTTYGQSVDTMYRGLMDSPGFSSLPQEMQVEALKKAESYATAFAKASVSDYAKAPNASTEELVPQILSDVAINQFTTAFSDISDDLAAGRDTSESVASLDRAYEIYSGLPDDLKNQVNEDSGGRVEYFLSAKEAGISTDTFTQMYEKYKDIGDKDVSTSLKAREWAVELEKAANNGSITKKQKNVLKDSMVFRFTMTAETVKFDNMTASGMSPETANNILHLMDGVIGSGKVDPETGKAAVRNIDKYNVIVGSGLPRSDIETALLEYMPDAMDEKYMYATRNFRISPEDFVEAYGVTQNYSRKNAQINAWMKLGYTRSEATQLYKLFKGKLT